jgi:prepilin-type N-terminal cleavage/methylation domain-containing protein
MNQQALMNAHTTHMTLTLNTPHRSAARRAFTLIELLVVIGIIGILAALAVPAATGVMKRAKKVRTSAALKDVQLGIKNYQVEYGRYPVKAGNTTENPVQLSEGAVLLAVLLGENKDKLNPRAIVYIEPPIAKGGVGGLTGSEGSYGLVDTWGSAYEVVMDANYDNKIANPDLRNEDSSVMQGAPPNLPLGVIVYSLGEDKKPNTADDVVSWRQ